MGGIKKIKHERNNYDLPEFPKAHFMERIDEISKEKVNVEKIREILLDEIQNGFKTKVERNVAKMDGFVSSLHEYNETKRIGQRAGLDLIVPTSFADINKNIEYHINEMDYALDELVTAIKKVMEFNHDDVLLVNEIISIANDISITYSEIEEENDVETLKYLESLYACTYDILENNEVDIPVPDSFNKHFDKTVVLYEKLKTISWHTKDKKLGDVFKALQKINIKADEYLRTLIEHDAFTQEHQMIVAILAQSPVRGEIPNNLISTLKQFHRTVYKEMTTVMAEETKKYMARHSEEIVLLNIGVEEEKKREQLSRIAEIVENRAYEYINAVLTGAKERIEKSTFYWLKVKIKLWMFNKGIIDESVLTESEDLYDRTGVKPWEWTKKNADEIINNKDEITKRYIIPAVEILTKIENELSVSFEEKLKEIYKALKSGEQDVQKEIHKFSEFVNQKRNEIFNLLE
ncbi:hypothetical protein J7J90_02415 [Candidatus Micrarchaeota archaeon]|nr:hypothetical protein [Candidatus Micrarchaeota archaeon]